MAFQGSIKVTAETHYVTSILLDEASITRRSPEIDHERMVAVNDLIEWNHFSIPDFPGPYRITISTAENRINLAVTSESSPESASIPLILSPFRGLIRDYFLICESYFDAVKTGNLPRIEAIDMSRRGLHNEGAELFSGLISDRINMDSETARRFFTLLCALHLK